MARVLTQTGVPFGPCQHRKRHLESANEMGSVFLAFESTRTKIATDIRFRPRVAVVRAANDIYCLVGNSNRSAGRSNNINHGCSPYGDDYRAISGAQKVYYSFGLIVPQMQIGANVEGILHEQTQTIQAIQSILLNSLPTNNRLRDMTTQARRLAEIDGQLPLALARKRFGNCSGLWLWPVMRVFERSRSSAARLSSQKRT